MNTAGRKEAGVAMRHKDVRVCLVGGRNSIKSERKFWAVCVTLSKNISIAAGFHFFQRWHVDGEPHPDFSARRNWYDLKLFPHRNCPTSSWGYDEQRLALKAAFKEHNISSTKASPTVKHIGQSYDEMITSIFLPADLVIHL
jgi:hypothetical protein